VECVGLTLVRYKRPAAVNAAMNTGVLQKKRYLMTSKINEEGSTVCS
jgi:hypothetical protein